MRPPNQRGKRNQKAFWEKDLESFFSHVNAPPKLCETFLIKDIICVQVWPTLSSLNGPTSWSSWTRITADCWSVMTPRETPHSADQTMLLDRKNIICYYVGRMIFKKPTVFLFQFLHLLGRFHLDQVHHLPVPWTLWQLHPRRHVWRGTDPRGGGWRDCFPRRRHGLRCHDWGLQLPQHQGWAPKALLSSIGLVLMTFSFKF